MRRKISKIFFVFVFFYEEKDRSSYSIEPIDDKQPLISSFVDELMNISIDKHENLISSGNLNNITYNIQYFSLRTHNN